ncbi:interleukin-17 receptor C isoform X1 [Danio rerio]|uniref:Interleukin-17 receptor C isoform X1 n=12 Tax=Danio rerio TaxID=7955 RepID=A0AC58GCK1_DANRE|nr:uncharacterized protein wu:fl23c11 isoform X1 [Danio rerio]|eukprot:XP_009302640.1 uncharacterized protein wu:fl23c11 isoform X1 [Danio rerio]
MCVCVMSVWTLLQLLVCVCGVCGVDQPLEKVELSGGQQLTCGQAVFDCEVRSASPACMCENEGVSVSGLHVRLVQCGEQKAWSVCLQILLNVTATDTGDEASADDEEGDEDLESVLSSASVCVCCYYPVQQHSKTLHFTFNPTTLQDDKTIQGGVSLVVQVPKAEYGSPVVVVSPTNSTTELTIPTQEEACSRGLDAVYCKAPRLYSRSAPGAGAFLLYVSDVERWRTQEFLVCKRHERDGVCVKLPWRNASQEFGVSFSSVAPCLCFEICSSFPRVQYCPFMNETVSSRSVSVSLSVSSSPAAVLWNVTAPCRLKLEVRLCVWDWRNSSCSSAHTHTHSHTHRWTQTNHTHWQLQGEFLYVQRHPSLCVQVEVSGLGLLDPVCPFEVRRNHWSIPLVLCVCLLCVTMLGAYAVQGTLKSWEFRWLKEEEETPLVSSVDLLLVSPPDVDGVCVQMCVLSSSLSALGFSVSLDLCSGSALCAVGPGPWLHAALRRGGRVVLVVTPGACARAEEWSRGARPEEQELLEDRFCSEVFEASLSRLRGRAAGPFLLVQFEGHCPPQALPELLQGLPLFSLPRQSLGFITELTRGAAHTHTNTHLRAAARVLSGALRDSRRTHTHTLQHKHNNTHPDCWI